MLGGAVAVLLTGQIAPSDALSAINVDVMVFLFGMFVVGEALSLSRYSIQFSTASSGMPAPPGSLSFV